MLTSPTASVPPLTRSVPLKSELVRKFPSTAVPRSITTPLVTTVTRPPVAKAPPSTMSCVFRARFTGLLPRFREPPGTSCRNPALRFRAPVSGLALARTSVPSPALVKPLVPATCAWTDAVAPAPSALTVMAGAVPPRVRVLAATPLLSRTQLAGVVGSVSPKTRLLTVRAESRCAVLSAVRSSVLKSALLVLPSATTAFSQFTGWLQRPPLTGWIHAPLPTVGTTSV